MTPISLLDIQNILEHELSLLEKTGFFIWFSAIIIIFVVLLIVKYYERKRK
jgi:hypothetical protein